MARLQLSLAMRGYDHVRDLVQGEVRAEGIDLVPMELPVEEIFFRFTRHREWHVSEMSFGKVAALAARGDPGFVCLPVFPSRVFRHSAIYVRPGAGIAEPKDLERRRVGIPEWAQTAGVYARGLLVHEYGVDLASMRWFQAGVREPGRIEKVELSLPAGVSITAMPERTLSEMLASGELDAAVSALAPAGGERLFADYPAVELAYWKKTRVFPIMHVVVLRTDVYQRDRWAAVNLARAFEEAKRRSLARAAEMNAALVPVPWLPDLVARWRAEAGEDFWPYGVEPNRATLQAFLQYAHEQGVCRRRLAVEELFAPETLERARI
jgi:4,5-dihydroxyphthalate decarboxylase